MKIDLIPREYMKPWEDLAQALKEIQDTCGVDISRGEPMEFHTRFTVSKDGCVCLFDVSLSRGVSNES